MRSAAVVAALVAGASAHYAQGNGTVSYTTEILTAYTTYCPAATSVVHNSKTYTVTEVSSGFVARARTNDRRALFGRFG